MVEESAMTAEEIVRKAKDAFDAIQDDAPLDVPRWADLHEVERRHLIKFAARLLENTHD